METVQPLLFLVAGQSEGRVPVSVTSSLQLGLDPPFTNDPGLLSLANWLQQSATQPPAEQPHPWRQALNLGAQQLGAQQLLSQQALGAQQQHQTLYAQQSGLSQQQLLTQQQQQAAAQLLLQGLPSLTSLAMLQQQQQQQQHSQSPNMSGLAGLQQQQQGINQSPQLHSQSPLPGQPLPGQPPLPASPEPPDAQPASPQALNQAQQGARLLQTQHFALPGYSGRPGSRHPAPPSLQVPGAWSQQHPAQQRPHTQAQEHAGNLFASLFNSGVLAPPNTPTAPSPAAPPGWDPASWALLPVGLQLQIRPMIEAAQQARQTAVPSYSPAQVSSMQHSKCMP